MSKRKNKNRNKKSEEMIQKIEAEARIKKVQEKTQVPGKWVTLDLACPKCNKEDNVYILDDNKMCYCLGCDHEFDVFDALDVDGSARDMVEIEPLGDKVSDVLTPEEAKRMYDADQRFKHVKTGTSQQKSLTGFVPKSSGYQAWDGKYQTYQPNLCDHLPQHIIKGQEDSWGVWAGKKEDCINHASKFDIVLNLTWTSIKAEHKIPVDELKHWEQYNSKYKEIQLDWPDFGVTNLPKEFWLELIDYLKTNKLRMLVFCQGGHGRTGTAIAILLVLSMRYAPQEAINWVRLNYCEHAIESKGQEEYIKAMAPKLGESKSEAAK